MDVITSSIIGYAFSPVLWELIPPIIILQVERL